MRQERIARVIVTWDCKRSCDFCCNNNLPVLPQPCGLKDLEDYHQVLLTGGEPMLHPGYVISIARYLRNHNPEQTIYLYTALWVPELITLAHSLDGIHYTLHYPLTGEDMLGFSVFQEVIREKRNQGKSFRLYIDPRITEPITIWPNLWSRVEVKPWLKECPLPKGETLLNLH